MNCLVCGAPGNYPFCPDCLEMREPQQRFNLQDDLWCPCENEQPDPCPLCGATVAGDDPVGGRCQYPYSRPDGWLQIVLIDKQTGEII